MVASICWPNCSSELTLIKVPGKTDAQANYITVSLPDAWNNEPAIVSVASCIGNGRGNGRRLSG
jgi:hypothetical protein